MVNIRRYLVLDHGCLECGKPTTILGHSHTVTEALRLASTHKQHGWLIIDLLHDKIAHHEWQDKVVWDETT